MSRLRTLSTRRLFILIAVFAVIAAGGAAFAVAAGGGGSTPQPKPLDQAIHDALTAPQPEGITARVKFTNNLFPSGSLLGGQASALMSGASGRLWLRPDEGRIELQSDAGDAQIVWTKSEVTVYDASSNTVYRATLPADTSQNNSDSNAPPSLTQIQDFLSHLAEHADVSGADPTNVAGQPAYSVRTAPKHDGGLLGSAELAWDAAQGVPLRVGIYAQGASSPVLELAVTDISYGAVSASDVEVAPPAGAQTVDVNIGNADDHAAAGSQVTGLDAVQSAAGFPVAAPDTLVDLPRRDVRLVGSSDSKAALVVYGQGLGAIVLLERKADSTNGQSAADMLSSLPTVALDGATGHELATQLGTIVEWKRDGVQYVLGGSLPPGAAEAAARNLG